MIRLFGLQRVGAQIFLATPPAHPPAPPREPGPFPALWFGFPKTGGILARELSGERRLIRLRGYGIRLLGWERGDEAVVSSGTNAEDANCNGPPGGTRRILGKKDCSSETGLCLVPLPRTPGLSRSHAGAWEREPGP